jgi:Flp pilus assembly pilin Flp
MYTAALCSWNTNDTQEMVPTSGNTEAIMALQFHSTRWRSNRQVDVSQINQFVLRVAVKNLFVRFVREDAGQDLIEYGLLIGIITIGTIAAIKAIGPKVAAYFNNLNAQL